MNELVFMGENSQALTNSLLVAEKFEKRHGDVIRAVENLILADAKLRSLFVSMTYVDEQMKERPMYAMNRDGFSLLAMGFTGKKAIQFKMDYINAFNAMEQALKERQKPLSQLEILVQSAQALLEHDNRISSVEQRLDKMDKDREENTKLLLSVPVSTDKIPELSLRDKIRQCVNLYAESTGICHQDVWRKIYAQLYYLYHISINAYKKDKKETNLDVAERNRFLDKIYTVISNMVREKQIA